MMKTTRFRPIAPRPQEGVGNNASSPKDKLSVGATMPPAVAPSGKSGALVDGGLLSKKSAATDKAVPNSLLKVKVEHGKAETNAAYAAGAQIDSEISLDPKNFCYAELKPLTDFENSSMSTGFYGSYGAGYYGYNSCQQFQYAGACAPHCRSGVACCSQGPQAVRHQWNASPSSMCYPNQASASAGGQQQQSFGSAGTYALAQGYQQPQQEKSAAATAAKDTKDAANGVKLDLDQDSVAKAFGEKDASASDGKQQQHDKRKEANESDGSVDALPDSPTANNNATDSETGAGVLGKRHASRIQSAAMAEVNESTKAAEGSDIDTVATHAVAPGTPMRMPTSGSIASLHHCISSQTTNPLFFIEKRLACSFISEYLEKEKEAAGLIEGFELQPQAKKQRV